MSQIGNDIRPKEDFVQTTICTAKKEYSENDMKRAWENGYSWSLSRNETIRNEKWKNFINQFKKRK